LKKYFQIILIFLKKRKIKVKLLKKIHY